ncbi:MAG: hypothetical protein HQM09_22385 [Candidatus Riflebacteria bacterium]|nr:hypothetical protein [Candidatus Riflebacteria bacterium]
MTTPNNAIDLVRLPFRLAKRATAPVADFVERHLGDEIQQIVGHVPGLIMFEKMCMGFNNWVSGRELPAPVAATKPEGAHREPDMRDRDP